MAGPSSLGAWLGPWRLLAIDGVQLDIPENAANLAECPTAVGGTHRPYP